MKKFMKFILSVVLVLALLVPLAACGGEKLATPQKVSIDEELTLTWESVPSARSYRIEIAPKDGERTENTSQRSNYDLNYLEEGDYTIRIRAVGGKANDIFSDWTEPYDFHRDYDAGLLYKLINGNTEYEVRSVGTASGDLTILEEYRGKPVTGIGDLAFRGSTRITSVVIPDTVTYIGASAFYNCSNLLSVTIPESVTSIGAAAFQQCSKLTTINIPAAVTRIESSTFAYCRSLEDLTLSDNIVSIGESAFTNCTAFTEFTIPDSVTTIGTGAFRQASGIQTLHIGKGVTSIGSNSFAQCAGLTEIDFKPLDGKLTIPSYAFSQDTSLERVELPEGVTAVAAYAFYGDSALEEVVIPDTVTELAYYAFAGTKFYDEQKNAESGDGLVYAGNWLVDATDEFKKTVTSLEPNNFRDGTVGIGNLAFCYIWYVEAKDENGETIYQPNSDEPVMVPEDVCCENLTRVTIPNTVKYIGMRAFYHAPQLQRFIAVRDPELVSVGKYAFANSPALVNVQFTNGLLDIGARAFSGCTSLNFNENNPEALVPASVTHIGESAFNGTLLAQNHDEGGLFYAGSWLVGYDFTVEPLNQIEIREGTKGIADYALYAYTSVQSITGLDDVTRIGRGAFAYCSSLSRVTLSPTLTSIKDYTFYLCKGLFSVDLPTMLESIGYAAFYRCDELDQLDLSGCTRLTSIGDYAFDSCKGLTSVDLGTTVESIGNYAFHGCRVLRTVEIPDCVTELGDRAFGDCLSLDNVKIGSGISEIGDYTFAGCIWLRRVSIPANIKSIGDYAFYNCERLLHLDIAEGVEQIGAYAFYGNRRLTHAEIPVSVKSIGQLAFKGCTSLEGVTFLGSPEYIDENAFYGCSRLTFYGTGAEEADWNTYWDPAQRPAVWHVTLTEDGYVGSVTVGEDRSHARLGYAGPGREGYVFEGWATEEGGEVVYSARDLEEKVPAGTVLYPVWKEAVKEDLGAWAVEYTDWYFALLKKEFEDKYQNNESWMLPGYEEYEPPTEEERQAFIEQLTALLESFES